MNENLVYTGCGSRDTPENVMLTMTHLAMVLANCGWTLRSGAAVGADEAFERGCDKVNGLKDIYLPWRRYQDHPSQQCDVGYAAIRLAAELHPCWAKLSDGSKRLHGRNVYQVLGREMDTPSRMLICWTPDGCEGERMRTKATGGTATAIVLAERYNIPVFNLFNSDAEDRIFEFFKSQRIL